MRRRTSMFGIRYWRNWYRWIGPFVVSMFAIPCLLALGLAGGDYAIYFFLASAFATVSAVYYLWKGIGKK